MKYAVCLHGSHRRFIMTSLIMGLSFPWTLDVVARAGMVSADSSTPHAVPASTYSNPLNVPAADPYVLWHEGVYYLYGTFDPAPNQGIPVWTSTDLVHWEGHGFAFRKEPDTWSQSAFWGPEVIFHDGRFLMYYSASPNERGADLPRHMSLCIAESDSPLGPFVELKAPLYNPDPPEEAIDQNIFIDEDGQAYLYYTLVTRGRNDIRVVKLKPSMIEFEGEAVVCVYPTDPWESHRWRNHLVAEGAYVTKRDGTYYLTYTANHFLDANYAIGYAVSSNPMGPWEKYEGNPILEKTDYIAGPGNGMIVPSPDGSEMFLVYHVHHRVGQVIPRLLAIDRIRFEPREGGSDALVVDGPTHTPQPLPSGSAASPQ